MNRCPNPSYNSIECPYALPEDSPLPCFGTDRQCSEYRENVNKTKCNNAIEQLEIIDENT